MLTADACELIIAVFVELGGLTVNKEVLCYVSCVGLDTKAEVLALGSIKASGSYRAAL